MEEIELKIEKAKANIKAVKEIEKLQKEIGTMTAKFNKNLTAKKTKIIELSKSLS